MTYNEFIQEARKSAGKILESKEHGIMNLVQWAWMEGKLSAEIEMLRTAIEEARYKSDQKVESAEEVIYPTWWKYMCMIGVIPENLDNKTLGEMTVERLMNITIPADIAHKLGIKPKEYKND